MSYVLRRFFGWAKQRRLVLADPTRPLRLGGQPGFVGTLLDVASQGQLINRWTSPATHPHERLTGLFALMHVASNAEIRALTLADIDDTRRAVQLHRRPFKTELDPITWPCLQDSLRYRGDLHTLNPHVIVTAVTRTRDSVTHSSYLPRLLAMANTTHLQSVDKLGSLNLSSTWTKTRRGGTRNERQRPRPILHRQRRPRSPDQNHQIAQPRTRPLQVPPCTPSPEPVRV